MRCATPMKDRVGRRRRFGRCGGFSLIEVVASMGVVSIIFLAVGSSMVLVARALPYDSGSESMLETTGVLDELTADLQLAISFSQRTARSVTFTVPDRDNDGSNEVIRYEWSGKTGDPLRRRINAGPSVVVADNVTAFDLAYEIAHEQTLTPTFVEGNETVLKSQNAVLSLNLGTVTSSRWLAQYIQPDLPSDAVSWRPTRMQLTLAAVGNRDGYSLIQLRPQNRLNQPAETVLAEAVLNESSLPAPFLGIPIKTTRTITFNNIKGLSPDMGVCLVIRHLQGPGDVVGVEYGGLLGLLGGTNLTVSNDGGSSWSTVTQSFTFYLYGRVVRPGHDIVTNTYTLQNIRATLGRRHEQHPSTATVSLLNRVEVAGP